MNKFLEKVTYIIFLFVGIFMGYGILYLSYMMYPYILLVFVPFVLAGIWQSLEFLVDKFIKK